MKFSLILATLNRSAEVDNFLHTLNAQTYRNFELVIIDQNSDDRLVEFIKSYQTHFPILHLRSEKGLSRARNVGLQHISGDIVAFPDDDCAYPPDILEHVVQFFTNNPRWNGLTGCSVDQQGKDSGRHHSSQAGEINRFNVWRRGISYTIFLRRSVVMEVGIFDETLGVGANTPWGSAEETDYLLRAINAGLYYEPMLTVIHPIKLTQLESTQLSTNKNKNYSKTYAYAMGRGRVLRKHNTPLWFVIYNWSRPLIGIVLSLLQGRLDSVKSYWVTFIGRLQGWFGWA
ncbi:MAG: glycosyltransferase [Desmonostoc vinosum HA7617-LM4]|jgi:glycosyltransferase involved in cell wall biosynthesis|nr:glycosyltransferase [Desmonostoc vinosum HA7617-LM4]